MKRFRLSKRQWWVAGILFVVYSGVMIVSEMKFLTPALFYASSAIGLGVLFLEGLELWPVVYLASLFGEAFGTFPLPFLILMPIAQSLQATAGAYILRRGKIDPLFRHSRDIFLLFGMILLVSLIVPSFGSLSETISRSAGYMFPIPAWGLRYTATIFCLLILTPFILRWFSKPHFSRTRIEIGELAIVFAVLIVIDYFVFIEHVANVFGVPLVYILLAPLFWIALRLRPRFITLALLITSGFGFASVFLNGLTPASSAFGANLYEIEIFLIIVATIFFIIAALEEDRRLNSNLMRSQLAMLENAVARISSESRAKNDFIAVLAHELRNPLAPVVSAIELLMLNDKREAHEMETLEMMDGRMQIVRRLLDDLLDISRISEGKIEIKNESVDLIAIARRAILTTTHHFKERHEQFIFKPSSDKIFVSGDAVRLEQVISNLLTNASKYSDPGDTITLSIEKNGSQAEIRVRDTGVGIDASVLENIFLPFNQVELGARTRKGLGIGLALVKNFVELHGGTVYATSDGIGKGSMFTVLLPLAAESMVEPVQGTTKKQSKTSGSTKTPTKKHAGLYVLVVDDNDAAAWGIGKLLELRGCSVEYAYAGNQAIEKAADGQFDAILLDVGLPDKDGYEVASAIRTQGFTGRLIALTGYSNEDARQKGEKAGFDHYLVKPAGFAELKRVLPEIA